MIGNRRKADKNVIAMSIFIERHQSTSAYSARLTHVSRIPCIPFSTS
jgi:hypothetical protein